VTNPDQRLRMHRIALAFRVFFLVLFNRERAEQVERALAKAPSGGQRSVQPSADTVVVERPNPKPSRKAARSEAVNLLAALQREARLVDFIKEPIAGYSDAQIGAAVRDVHRDCAAAVERIFGLKPIDSAGEGAEIEVPSGFDPSRIRLVGNVVGQPPFRGKLCHHGWEATRCELPAWTGGDQAVLVVAPAEVELR
jgi:hypothetical protein